MMRLDALDDQDVATTVITIEERMRGWLAWLNRSNDLQRQVLGYQAMPCFCLPTFRIFSESRTSVSSIGCVKTLKGPYPPAQGDALKSPATHHPRAQRTASWHDAKGHPSDKPAR
jgi:hypothetical protein